MLKFAPMQVIDFQLQGIQEIAHCDPGNTISRMIVAGTVLRATISATLVLASFDNDSHVIVQAPTSPGDSFISTA